MKNNVLIDFPSCINPKVNELIVKYAKKRELPAKKIFVQPGDIVDSIFYIFSGRTRHYMINTDGVEKISYILNNGWFLREGTFVRSSTETFAARFSITELPTTLYVIGKDCYNRLIDFPDFSNELLRSSTTKNDLLRKELESIVFDTAKDRLLKLFTASMKASKIIDEHWHELNISYSHQEIAAILGVNRVTISRLIAKAMKDGELRTVNSRIQINSTAVSRLALVEESETDS